MILPPPCVVRLAGGGSLRLGDRTLVMAVVNITPDSFAERQPSIDASRAVDLAQAAEAQGADLLDVGAESTRPGASVVPVEEELRRLLPVLRAVAPRIRIPISVDTRKAPVARAAIDAGAGIVNDVSGLMYDPALGDLVAAAGAGLILMHTRGTPDDMYRGAIYGDVVAEVRRELAEAMARAARAGVPDEALVLDPGIGFAKRAEHSHEVLARLGELRSLGRPLLVGPSRKSFLHAAGAAQAPAERDWATAAAVTASIMGGAQIVRVHAVAEMVQVVRVADEIRRAAARAAGRG
ncbi:MAG TPA: dihydropteroate synthase [Vicinamibacterales bacterium]|nr:dihydropteroate synthase [Vicinamibacterales bacterium]